MSNAHRTDPYFRLLRIMIVLLVLFVVFLVGYLLLDSHLRGRYIQEQGRIVEENNAMVQAYNDAVLAQRTQVEPDVAPDWPVPAQTGTDIVSLKGYAVKGTNPVTISRAEALKGGLMLLNRWHMLPADFALVESEIDSIMTLTDRRVPTESREMSLFPEAVTALDEMIAAAKADGLENYIVRGAYRTMQTQTNYWNAASERLSARYSGDMLTEEVRKGVSYPGTSDYQSGLSVEIKAWSPNDPVLNAAVAANFQTTEQAKWLYENSWKYGYVFRFPVSGYPNAQTIDKSYKTGIDLKMDAYRYVGIPHARVMHEKQFSLEEYIEYLIENKHIAVYEEGQLKYEIFRVAYDGEDAEVSIPANAASYSASADNMGGLVVAVTY